ncbi:MAG: hypothetical protein E7B87_00745 [Streptococcus salivarius]|nr:hypothetical protein [Streptococcus salivarius]
MVGIAYISSLAHFCGQGVMLFEPVSSFPFDEGFKTLVVDENQFVRRVEHVLLKVFVIPHFSDKVLCHRLP